MKEVHQLLFIITISLCALIYVYATCSNGCSQHGQCTSNHQCLCDYGYTAADCSERLCPAGKPWTDYPTADHTVRDSFKECSHMGLCNRNTGECDCRAGFEGMACERMSCPISDTYGICGGHGVCKTMREISEQVDDYRLMHSNTYDNWDADKIMGCLCDEGYHGYNCTLRYCPMGDDPVTTGQMNEIQNINCNCQSTCSGSFKLYFQGQLTADINHNDNAVTVESKLTSLSKINDITVVFSGGSTACSSSGDTVAVTFTHNPGNLNNLRIKDSTLISTSGTPPTIVVTETVAGTRENVECSNRGRCHSSGQCQCYKNLGYFFFTAGSDGMGGAGNIPNCGHVVLAVDECPNLLDGRGICSGNGICTGTPNYKCSCYPGYTGAACEDYECFKGKSWFDEATDMNVAHTYGAECSNKGICSQTTSQCSCEPGFTGSACERLTCPENCSYKGLCLTMEQLSAETRTNGVHTPYDYGKTSASWDYNMIQGCNCDKDWYHGPLRWDISDFSGHNCISLTCPNGDDPQTDGQVYEQQIISCTADGGTFKLKFRGMETYSLPFSASATIVATIFSKLKTVRLVSLAYSTGAAFCSDSGVTSTFTFLQALGDVPDIQVDSSILTRVSGSVSVTVTETIKGTKENVECSNRGVCDRVKGVCKCFTGYASSDGNGGIGNRGDCGYKSQDYWYYINSNITSRVVNATGHVV